MGNTVTRLYTNSCGKLLEIRRRVSNEAHHFREFARFQSLDSRVYISHLEPQNDVILLVGRHFADRMPSEHWMIIDDNRKIACVHPMDGENYLRYLTEEEFKTLQQTEAYEDEFTDNVENLFSMLSALNRERITSARETYSPSGSESMLWN